MKWYSYLICTILIIVGIFCTIQLVDIFNVTSGEYGNVITFESENNLNEVSKFDYGTIEFDTDDLINYSSITTYSPTEFNGLKEDYYIYFNNQPLNNVEQSAGVISGDLSIKFYDLRGSEITTAKVNFVIEYMASSTKVTATIKNEKNSVSYLNSYMELNGAVLQVFTKENNL